MSEAVYFFFFQAEDGIRDYKVTGVQTCALSISTKGHTRLQGDWSSDVCSSDLSDRASCFCQAEDGIRDYKVTGVQTCALAISRTCGTPRQPCPPWPRPSPPPC